MHQFVSHDGGQGGPPGDVWKLFVFTADLVRSVIEQGNDSVKRYSILT
jgi:hypothetical protein